MNHRHIAHILYLLFAVVLFALTFPAAASPRVTPTVEVIRKAGPAVVPIFASDDKGGGGSGTGAIIHEAGYILTADHVTRNFRGVVIINRTRVPYKVIGRLPGKDLAILKIDSPKPLPFIELGISDDVESGEPVIVAGNPGGRGIVYSSGIVSAPSLAPNMPSALAATFFPDSRRDDFIQFDAASNRGNSGGPLLNVNGKLIGVVAAKKFDEESINWAIPASRLRRLFENLAPTEELNAIWAGVRMDHLAPRAVVREVEPDSPAAKAGLKAGDIVKSLGGQRVGQGTDWLLVLNGRKAGDELALEFERNGASRKAKLTLAAYPVPAPIAAEGKSKGLRYAVFPGKFDQLPDFKKLKPTREGNTDALATETLTGGIKEDYALEFKGYLNFPRAGLYTVALESDDGAKLYLNDRLMIDNDFKHPPQELSRLVRVPAGLLPLRIEYFQGISGSELKLSISPAAEPEKLLTQDLFYRD